ncbi:GIN domain-containing protein [Flavobacterium sp. I3-2]|uniref:GIN domain-containing protein n=1 Tax=Flavobacterium sp. I3-2 TaxID=2748319 RepID=UPI0015AC83CF|nr:DUF2807 domain-containing protein [Flavobacterium sp. I3-2]
MRKIYFLLFTITILSSCKNPDVNNNSSEITSETVETAIYKIDSFNKITNKTIVNIEITDEVPLGEIHIISTKSNLEEIEHHISNNELIISQKNKTFTLKDNTQIIAKVNAENITKFSIAGAGYIKSSITQKSDKIETEIKGAGNLDLIINNNSVINKIEGLGNVSLKGRTNISETNIEGAGNLDAFDLETNTTIVSIDGVGNADVNVSENLTASISGVGNLTYKGNPKEIVKKKSGLGSINQY